MPERRRWRCVGDHDVKAPAGHVQGLHAGGHGFGQLFRGFLPRLAQFEGMLLKRGVGILLGQLQCVQIHAVLQLRQLALQIVPMRV